MFRCATGKDTPLPMVACAQVARATSPVVAYSRHRMVLHSNQQERKRSSPHLGHTSLPCLRDLRASDFLLASRFSLLASFRGTPLAPLLPEEPKGGYLNHNPRPSTSLFFKLNIPWL